MPLELNPNVQFRGLVSDMSDVVDEAILNMLESTHPDDKVLASLAEARGNVVRMNHALKVVNISIVGDQPHNHTLPEGAKPKALDLPKLQKQAKPKSHSNHVQRPGINKYKKGPKDFMCPTCKAEPHTRCFVMTGPGHKSQVTSERRDDDWAHNARVKLSATHNEAAIAKYDRDHFEAQS